MMNMFTLIGRITNDEFNIEVNDKGQKEVLITIEGKKADGTNYHLPIKVRGQMAETVNEYCFKGAIAAFKGSLNSIDNSNIELYAEKMTVLNSEKNINKKKEDMER